MKTLRLAIAFSLICLPALATDIPSYLKKQILDGTLTCKEANSFEKIDMDYCNKISSKLQPSPKSSEALVAEPKASTSTEVFSPVVNTISNTSIARNPAPPTDNAPESTIRNSAISSPANSSNSQANPAPQENTSLETTSTGLSSSNLNIKRVKLVGDWRTRELNIPWSEPLLVSNESGTEDLVLFDKNWVRRDIGGYNAIEEGFITRFTPEEIGIFIFRQQVSCDLFGLLCIKVGPISSSPVGNIIEVVVGGQSFKVYGDNGLFPVNDELADALRKAPLQEAIITVNLSTNSGGIGSELIGSNTLPNKIGVQTVQSWKVIYAPQPQNNAAVKYALTPVETVSQPLDTEQLVQRTLPSVLNIKTKKGSGTGFLLTPTGLILTNRHVVSGDNQPQVFFYDGSSRSALVLKRDGTKDLALLKVELPANAFQALPLCFADSTKVGADVTVIGNPGGLPGVQFSNTVTRGILSGIRDTENQTLLQTDAAVNPGNSGGPMLNKYGEVIAIVNSKLAARGIDNIGFGIPIGEAVQALGLKVNPLNTGAISNCGNPILQPPLSVPVVVEKKIKTELKFPKQSNHP